MVVFDDELSIVHTCIKRNNVEYTRDMCNCNGILILRNAQSIGVYWSYYIGRVVCVRVCVGGRWDM